MFKFFDSIYSTDVVNSRFNFILIHPEKVVRHNSRRYCLTNIWRESTFVCFLQFKFLHWNKTKDLKRLFTKDSVLDDWWGCLRKKEEIIIFFGLKILYIKFIVWLILYSSGDWKSSLPKTNTHFNSVLYTIFYGYDYVICLVVNLWRFNETFEVSRRGNWKDDVEDFKNSTLVLIGPHSKEDRITERMVGFETVVGTNETIDLVTAYNVKLEFQWLSG